MIFKAGLSYVLPCCDVPVQRPEMARWQDPHVSKCPPMLAIHSQLETKSCSHATQDKLLSKHT
jgi:hypothetical protein